LSLGKKNIVKNIKTKTQIPVDTSKDLLVKFIDLISIKSKKQTTKISGFGSFKVHNTPNRIGRNPLTKQEYLISARKKIIFRPSNKIKKILN